MKRKLLSIILLVGVVACQRVPAGMVYVPGGEFLLGTGPLESLPQFLSERTASMNAQPAQKRAVGPFYIDRYEVTYEQFLRFKPQAKYEGGAAGEPMRGVSWYEADAYCQWLGKRLPTEFEWEKSARGTDGRIFTWGNEFQRDYANLGKSVKPPGSFEKDKSPFDVYDMNGNVAEWTASAYRPYPNSNYADQNFGETLKVIRGGSIQRKEHGFMKEFATLFYRNYAPPAMRAWDTGFRCAKSA